jgi:hypothetical protein
VQGLSLKKGLSLRQKTASGPGRIKNTYHHMTKSSTTPIVMLTLQDLRDVIREEMGSSVNVTHESETPSASQHVPAKLAGKEVVFGLAGICKIFNCKMSRAQKLKNTIIKDAVHQNGRTIITDVQKAYELFETYSKKRR